MDRFQKNPIDDNMLLNSCAKWNKRGSFPKTHKLLLYAIQLVCVLKWNKRDSFKKKKHQFITVAIQQEGQFSKKFYVWYSTCVRNETRGTVFKKKKTPIYYSMLFNKRGSFQKTTIYYCMLFNLCAYWNETRGIVFKKTTKTPIYYSMLFNKRGSFQKTTIYYCMLFNLCAYWNETRGTVFKKKTPIYYSMLFNKRAVFKKSNWWQYDTELVYEMKQEGQFSKKKNKFITVLYYNNLLLYAIQLVCVLKWNKRDSFKKNQQKHQFISMLFNKRGSFQKQQFITVCYSTCVRIEMKQEGQFSKKNTNLLQYALQQEGQFSKNNNLLLYAIQLVCVSKWNKRGSFPKTHNYYCMLFNLCVYWNETRGTVFKKKKKTTKTPIYYSMLFNLCAYWNQTRWTDFKKIQNNTLLNSIETRGAVFHYSMLFNLCAYWNETRWTVFKKIQLMTICYWTHVRNETRGAVFQKHTNYYCMLFNLCAYWNETRGTVFKKI